MPFSTSVVRRAIALALVCLGPSAAAFPQPPPREPQTELDAFMEKVLARREVNRKTLDQYVLDEVERFEILGPGRFPLHRSRREYTWYVRDGMHVRSPLRYNGVSVGEEARDRYEENWIRRERQRQERKAEKEREKREIVIGPGGVDVTSPAVPTEPRFVSEAYFMDFKFEPGNYYLAGREQLEGKEVLRIEYYPERLFIDDDKKVPREVKTETRGERRERELEQDIERKMNKTALITLWIDPSEHQIVKYTFENVWLDFLPGAWLVRVDDMRASMTMGQPFSGVWLPRGIDIHAGITLANGSYEAGYERAFSEYRLAEVKTRIGVPKKEPKEELTEETEVTGKNTEETEEAEDTERAEGTESTDGTGRADPSPGPYVPVPEFQPEVIREIRIHGNAFLSDDEVLRIAGVSIGQPLEANALEAIRRRLDDSGRFESIDVRKRYRSLNDTTDVALVLVVHEKPGVRSSTDPTAGVRMPGPIRAITSRLMFLPIISYADGYGFTYGGRVSAVDLIGLGERLSVPLTWGGVRRAALEFERTFDRGPLTRIDSSVSLWNRRNPRFEIRDQRFEVKGRAERVFADLLRASVEASRATIDFGAFDDRLWTVGTGAAIDTRLDPAFPGNAVLLGAGVTRMNFRSLPEAVLRYTTEGRGYLRIFRQIVVAGRAQYTAADTTLPPYERLLLGGSSTLRGFRTGAFDGDRMLVTSAEVRVPITSVLSGAKFGVTAFLDSAKIWDVGTALKDAEWRQGVGGGVFLIASIVRVNLDVARGLETGDTRVHLSSGFTF